MLTREEERALLDLPGETITVRANQDFVHLGERVEHACLIADGLVGRFDQNRQGSRQITAIHMPGDMADLHSVVQPQATSALQALSVATVLRIPHKAIRSAAAKHPALAEALWRDCMVDAAILAQWIVNVGRRDARSSLAHLLCEIAVRLEVDVGAGAFCFPFPVTQAQLADATGLTIVHVNRTLRALREDGLSEITRQEVRVLDWEGLVRAGDFEPGYLQRENTVEGRLRIVPPVDQLIQLVAGPMTSWERGH